MRWQLHGVSYIVSKCHELRSTNGFKLDANFYPLRVLHCQASQTEISKLNSTKRSQTVDSNNVSYKSWGTPLEKKIGGQKLLHLFRFSTTSRFNGNICWTKRDIDNPARALESTKGLLRCAKILWNVAHKRLKTGPEFLPTPTISFCPSLSHTLYAAVTWRPTATLNETALGSSAAQIWSPGRC